MPLDALETLLEALRATFDGFAVSGGIRDAVPFSDGDGLPPRYGTAFR